MADFLILFLFLVPAAVSAAFFAVCLVFYRRASKACVAGDVDGYSFRFYVEAVPREHTVKMLSVNGVLPTAENIKSGKYPLVTEFYAVCRADNDDENVRCLLDWLLSDEGQALIEAVGYARIK